jgi:hypothetical protein
MLVGPSQEGGGLCRPVSAPAQQSEQKWGYRATPPPHRSRRPRVI